MILLVLARGLEKEKSNLPRVTSEPEESLLLLEDCCDEEESEKWGILTKFHSYFIFSENKNMTD